MRKILKAAVDVVIAAFLAFSFLTIISVITGNGFFGYHFVSIKSSSMIASGINVGDVRAIRGSDTYNIGDIIAFHHGDYIYYHEIIGGNAIDGFITKGSSNTMPDSGVATLTDIIGRQVSTTNFNWINSLWFKLSLVFITYFLIMGYLIQALVDIWKQEKQLIPKSQVPRKKRARRVVILKRRKRLKGKRIILMALPFFLLSSVYTVWAANSTALIANQQVSFLPIVSQYFTFNQAGNTITGYDNNSGEIVVQVPATHNGATVTKIDSMVFLNNSSMETLIIPESVTSIGWINFFGCSSLQEIIIYAENPICTFTSLLGLQLSSSVKIYVPDNVVNTYKNSSSWYYYRTQIYPLSSRP